VGFKGQSGRWCKVSIYSGLSRPHTPWHRGDEEEGWLGSQEGQALCRPHCGWDRSLHVTQAWCRSCQCARASNTHGLSANGHEIPTVCQAWHQARGTLSEENRLSLQQPGAMHLQNCNTATVCFGLLHNNTLEGPV
jgi:hypothetical protein